MSTLLHDLRYGIRLLVAKPGFSSMAVIVLALGIGANTAIFSLVNAFLLKPLVIQKAEELTGVYSRDTRKPDSYRAFSYPNYADLRDKNTVFTSLMAHNLAMVGLADGDSTRRVFADIVSANYFSTFGVPLFRGRAFTAAEERPGSAIPVAIVSYSHWKKNGADPDLIGKTLRINARIYTVVGIAPQGFTGTTALISAELYAPLGMYESLVNDFAGGSGRALAARDNAGLILVGRLRPGLSAAAADSQLAAVASQMERAWPAENKDQTFIARPLSRLGVSTNPINDSQLMVPAALLLSLATVVLLIASMNVANMMLARGAARRKEIAIRLALGGGRKNILQQLVAEGLVLAFFGGAAGLAVSYWSTDLLVHSLARLAPVDLVYSAGPDLRVLAATMSFCLLSTLLFGLMPAWSLSRPNMLSDLKDGESGGSAGKPRRLFSRRNVLVMSQISLSLMLLTAAGLFIRSSLRAAQVDPGFSLDNGVLIELDPSLAGYDEARGRQVYQALLDRLRTVPGVQSASVAATAPFGMVSLGRPIQRSSDANKSASVASRLNMVSENYFETLGIPLLQGRAFDARERNGTAPRVAILDKSAAGRLWPKGGAVGQHIRVNSGDGRERPQDAEVVGVVGDVREHLSGAATEAHVYLPFGQQYQANANIHLKIAASGREAQTRLLESVRGEIREVDARVPVLALKTLRDHLDGSFDLWIARTGARMFAIFGGVALLLAMIGLYGVRAYTVARRTREIGIRMALGADAGDTLRLVLREGLLLTTVGVGAGLALSLALGKLLSSLLFEVSDVDPVVFSVAPVLLAAISLLACYIPARRAAHVDPMVALRHD
ncbi:MAG: ABC transporter permease [Acidobacteriota bacterium]|nr:ABC transporter permease [Acidobacteriota bacterium]